MIGFTAFSFAAPETVQDFGVRTGFSPTESALSPVRLDPTRSIANIQNTEGIIDFLFSDNPERGLSGEGKTTEQIELPPEAPFTFNQQAIGAAIIGVIIVGVLFFGK